MKEFDFIVVGSGPSALTIAQRLSSFTSRPNVLHLVAHDGQLQRDTDIAVDSYHWAEPLASTPQEHLGGRVLSLATGHALGGASTLEAYHDAWAKKVGDASYRVNGKGSRLGQMTHERSASHAKPSNLTVDHLSQPERVIFDGKRAIGILTDHGIVHALKEVILCAGALRTPHLLLLSGIGPQDRLASLNIPLVCDIPVGETLKDSLMIPIVWEVGAAFTDSADWLFEPETMRAHIRQFLNLETNLGKDQPSLLPVVSGQSDATLDSHDLQNLPFDSQTFIKHPTTSHWEMCPLPTSGSPETNKHLLQINCYPQVVTSTGFLHLASGDTSEPPLVNPSYLSQPIDRQNAIDAVRVTTRFFDVLASLSNDVLGPFNAPAGDDDADVLAFIKQSATTGRHYSCTLPMGSIGDRQTCVDSCFCVLGVQGLRVADLSVTPLLPATHSQLTPRVLGLILADKLAQRYELNE